MIFHTALLGGILIAGHASAKVNALFQRSEDLETLLRRNANALVATFTERDVPNIVVRAPQASITPASGDASQLDLAKWENDTRAACQAQLTKLNGQATNPTGLAVCYNLPFLDNQTGIFQAELRMYTISAPIDPWVGISAAAVNMSLSYDGAMLQSTNGVMLKRDVTRALMGRQNSVDASPLEELKVQTYIGQINSNLMGTAMNNAELRKYLIPIIELTAKRANSDETVLARLSSRDASFVNGVFADQTSSPTDPAAAAASASAAALAAVPFVVPGRQLAFFPVGLVITCVWTGLFIAAVGAGTVGRMQFREQYRRRMKRELASGFRTI